MCIGAQQIGLETRNWRGAQLGVCLREAFARPGCLLKHIERDWPGREA